MATRKKKLKKKRPSKSKKPCGQSEVCTEIAVTARNRRISLGLSQEVVGAALGNTRANYAFFEQGRQDIRVSLLEPLAEVLETRVADLLPRRWFK